MPVLRRAAPIAAPPGCATRRLPPPRDERAEKADHLGTPGATISDRFAERIERHRLEPKHVGPLTALGRGSFAWRQDLAGQLGVATAWWCRSPTTGSPSARCSGCATPGTAAARRSP
ncbi:hypothetical protein ACQPXS_16555 [Streptomyces sp. CA-142005]|uniref:hypothetical protein n=1 Tax=Streptomyces sp. CA-142005 TaxID=3240052 RepID=UPI003D8F3A7D